MTAAQQRIAELERQVAELAATVQKVARDAATVKTLDEMRRARQVNPGPAVPLRRPRHLYAVGSPR